MLRMASGLSQDKFAKRLNLSRGLYNGYETGREPAPDWVVQQVDMLERLGVDVLKKMDAPVGTARPPATEGTRPARRAPIIRWAEAGRVTTLDELPKDGERAAFTECADPRAFGIEIEGDSMEKDYHEGDVVIVMPSVKPVNHSLVVAKLRHDGVTFKLLSFVGPGGKTIRLSSLNPVYAPADYTERDFHWIYPVHSVTRLVWRRA